MTAGGSLDLVLDVGTGSVKGALVGDSRARHAEGEHPLPGASQAGNISEQDAQAWWTAASALARDLTQNGGRVARVVLTGQMQTLTLNGHDGRPLRQAISYGDTRAQEEAAELAAMFGETGLQSATGNDVDAASLLAKALWLKRHEPDALEHAAGVSLGAADHLAGRLTGRVGPQAVCDTTTASTTGLMDRAKQQALPGDVFDRLGLAGFAAKLPRFVAGGTQAGVMNEAAAAGWHVPAGTPVHVAPGDAGSNTVGAGAGEPGAASIYLGTSGWLAFTADAAGDPNQGVFNLAHPGENRVFQVAPLLTAAGNLAWFEKAHPSERSTGERIDAALSRPPTPLIYLPYLAGERSPFRDPDVRGAFVGLTTETTQDDMLRAVLEGVAFAYRHAAEALQVDASAQENTSWTVSGGGSRSPAWMALLASVLGRPLQVLGDAEWAGVQGAWHAARVSAGETKGWSLPVEGQTVQPTVVPGLGSRYRTFREATDALRPVFRQAVEGA